jgi:peptidoglycan/xylan/chitin deacetylase (PgdA/CDA1 family)
MVLGYHRVDDVDDELAVSPAHFAEHMEHLALRGPPVLGLEEAASALAAGTAPQRSVVLTFDDAWADNHERALPILAEQRLPATLFVPSRLIGTTGYMSQQQVMEMHDAGVTIGAHTQTHPDLRRCDDAALEREVRGSRDDLEDLLGVPVRTFAYPTGLYDDRVRDVARRAGYTLAVTTRRGWMTPSSEPFDIPRSFIEEFDRHTFDAACQGGLHVVAPLEAIRARRARRAGL